MLVSNKVEVVSEKFTAVLRKTDFTMPGLGTHATIYPTYLVAVWFVKNSGIFLRA